MKVFLALLLVILLIGGLVLMTMMRHGLSARQQPTRVEEAIARGVRRFAMPSSARNLRNPVALSDGALADARAHWADHCAVCHANDGSGETTIGQGLYPKAPDMRQARTQDLSDGELFYVIRNGVRFTGMPGWGTDQAADDRDSWALVHFIRRLPRLTLQEIEEMSGLNPKSPHELAQEREAEEFLSGAAVPSPPASPGGHDNH